MVHYYDSRTLDTMRLFSLFDRNKDGYISPTDLRHFMYKSFNTRITREEAKEILININNDLHVETEVNDRIDFYTFNIFIIDMDIEDYCKGKSETFENLRNKNKDKLDSHRESKESKGSSKQNNSQNFPQLSKKLLNINTARSQTGTNSSPKTIDSKDNMKHYAFNASKTTNSNLDNENGGRYFLPNLRKNVSPIPFSEDSSENNIQSIINKISLKQNENSTMDVTKSPSQMEDNTPKNNNKNNRFSIFPFNFNVNMGPKYGKKNYGLKLKPINKSNKHNKTINQSNNQPQTTSNTQDHQYFKENSSLIDKISNIYFQSSISNSINNSPSTISSSPLSSPHASPHTKNETSFISTNSKSAQPSKIYNIKDWLGKEQQDTILKPLNSSFKKANTNFADENIITTSTLNKERRKKVEGTLKSVFNMIDKNNSGQISVSDLAKFIERILRVNVKQNELYEISTFSDKREIDFDEFTIMFSKVFT